MSMIRGMSHGHPARCTQITARVAGVIAASISSGSMFWLIGSMPGQVARRRHHPWADAVSVAGWITLIFGFVLWPLALIWAYVDVPARGSEEQWP